MLAENRNLVAFALVGLVGLTACSSEPEVPPQPGPDAGATAPPPQPPPPAPAPTTPPPGPVAGPCDAGTQVALDTAIQARAKTEVGQGMKPEGAFTCQTVPEGGSATVAVTLQPGKCYTALEASMPNVNEVDLFLKPNFGNPPPPLLIAFAGMVLAQDSNTGPVATMAGGANCYKNPLPIPGAAVVEVKARTGAGPVAVQVYSK